MTKSARLRAIAAVVAVLGAAGGLVAAASARPSHSSATHVLHLALDGKSVKVSGTLESGATRIVYTAGRRGASPTLIRLNPGVSDRRFNYLLSSPAMADVNNVVRVGAIVVDTASGPGTHEVDATLQPGRYAIVDTNGNDPAKFPRAFVDVTRSASAGSLPRPQATVHMVEFAYRAPAVLHRGQLVRWENNGFIVHMAIAMRVPAGVGAQGVVDLLKRGAPQSEFPKGLQFASPAGPLSHGAWQQMRLDLAPGTWVLACFMDTQDGREHTQLGMERIVTVK